MLDNDKVVRVTSFFLGLLSVFSIFISFSTESVSGGVYTYYYLIVMILPLTYFFINFSLVVNSGKRTGYLFLIIFLFMLVLASIINETSLQYICIMIWCCISGAMLGSTMTYLKYESSRILELYICINVLFLFYQILLVAVSGENSYIHGQIFSFSRQEYSMIEFDQFFRFSGYQLEPGSYSTIVALACFMYKECKGRANYIYFIASFSIVLTLSTIGFLFFLLLMINTFNLKELSVKKMLLLFFLLLFAMAVLQYLGVFEYLFERFSGGMMTDSSSSVKVENVRFYMDNVDISKFLFGYGIFPDLNSCTNCGHIKSNGVIFYTLFTFGTLVSIFLLFLIVLRLVIGFDFLLLSLSFLLIRYTPLYPIYWTVLTFMLVYKKNEKNIIHTA